MTKFEFTTDRTYDGPQRIVVRVLGQIADEFGNIDADVEFHDTSRHIRARALLLLPADYSAHQLQRALMRAYDAGQYQ